MLLLWFVTNSLLAPININLGGFRLGLNVFVLTLAGMVWIGRNRKITDIFAKALLIFFVFLIVSFAIAIFGPCNDKLIKLILTVPILLFLTLVALEVGGRANDNDWLYLQKIGTWILLAASTTFIFEAIFPDSFPNQAGYRYEGKLSGMFGEPSHVAYFLFPWITILLVAENRQSRRSGILALVGLLLLSRSSTLFALIVGWILYRMFILGKVRQSLLVALVMALLVTLGSVINYERFVEPTIERLAGVTTAIETAGISSLVYRQGWQDAWSNLQRTNGLGLGFNMMGCDPLPDVQARKILSSAQLELNAEDGSFLFSKVISETGVIGLIFFVAAIWWWIKLEYQIRKCNDPLSSEIGRIHSAIMFCFITTSFLRSTGYFDGVLFFWIVAVAGSVKWYKKREFILSTSSTK